MKTCSIWLSFSYKIASICVGLCIISMALPAISQTCEEQFLSEYVIRRQPLKTNDRLGMRIKRTAFEPAPTRPVPTGKHVGVSHSSDLLIYVHQGSGVLKFADKEFDINPGSIIFIPAGNSYRYDSTGEELVTMETFNTAIENVVNQDRYWTKSKREPLVTHFDDQADWSEWQAGNPVLTRFVADGTQSYQHSSMVFGFAKIPPGYELMRHRHPDHHYEAYYILEGEASSYINDKLHSLPAGQGLFIEGGAYHHTQNHGQEDLKFLFVFTNEDQFTDVEYILD